MGSQRSGKNQAGSWEGGKSVPTRVQQKRSPRSRSAKFSAKLAPPKVDTKPKKAAGKNKYADKNVQTKGKREQRENKPRRLTLNLSKIYLEKTEAKNEESPDSDEAEEKGAKSV